MPDYLTIGATIYSFIYPVESGTTFAGSYDSALGINLNIAIDRCTPFIRGGIPELRFQRVVGALAALPDPFDTAAVAWSNGTSHSSAITMENRTLRFSAARSKQIRSKRVRSRRARPDRARPARRGRLIEYRPAACLMSSSFQRAASARSRRQVGSSTSMARKRLGRSAESTRPPTNWRCSQDRPELWTAA